MKPSYEDLYKGLKVAEEALEFYADPPRRDESGDWVSVPDFYFEMDFGDRAAAALSHIKPLLLKEE